MNWYYWPVWCSCFPFLNSLVSVLLKGVFNKFHNQIKLIFIWKILHQFIRLRDQFFFKAYILLFFKQITAFFKSKKISNSNSGVFINKDRFIYFNHGLTSSIWQWHSVHLRDGLLTQSKLYSKKHLNKCYF